MENKILFRCDGGKVPEIGTGHLFRAIAIAQILKKKLKLKKNQINFITKNKGKYKLSLKILKKNNLIYKIYNDKLLKENSLNEINILKKNSSKILIIDRWGHTKKNTILRLRKYFSKIILFDDMCKHKEFDLKINSLIKQNKKEYNFKTFKKLILPSYNYKKFFFKDKKQKKIVNNIFVSFGGFDKNLYSKRIIELFKNLNLNLNLFIPASLANNKIKRIRFKKLNIIYFNNKDFYKYLNLSDISVVSGGLTLFDSLLFKIPSICLPQYNHQFLNAKIVNKLKANLIINPNNIDKSFIYNFNNLYNNYKLRKKLSKNGTKIINLKNMENILNRIFKLYEK